MANVCVGFVSGFGGSGRQVDGVEGRARRDGGRCEGRRRREGSGMIWMRVGSSRGRRAYRPQEGQSKMLTDRILKELRLGNRETAMKLFGELHEGGEASVVGYNRVMRALGRSSTAEFVYSTLLKRGLKGDVVTFNTKLKLHAQEGDLKGLRDTREEMKRVNVRPDVVTFTTLINAFGSVRDFTSAESALLEMKAEGIEPDLVTFNTIMKLHALNSDVAAVRSVFQQIVDSGCPPDSVSYGILMKALEQEEHHNAVENVFRTLLSKQTRPNLSVLTSIARSRAKQNNVKGVIEALDIIDEYDLRPNAILFNRM